MTVNLSSTEADAAGPLPMRSVVRTWWPLAASWMLMSIEGPMMSAVVARLAYPEISLAAWGGVVWPLILVIESPILMLLSASTALSRDWDSYRRLYKFMMWTCGILTGLHALIAFTPLYYVVAVDVIGAPAEIIEPARLGLQIIIPWTWTIGYRRFHQGVMIRFGHSRAVGLGTLIRLSTDALILTIGYLVGTLPGIAVASGTIAAGVTSEAIYVGLRVRPVLRYQVRQVKPVGDPLTLRAFLAFYTPLAMTSALNMLTQPIGSAALSRMPRALDSLAAWSVVSGFVFFLRSLGVAFNEVVIAMLDEPRSTSSLRRFAAILVTLMSAVLLIVVATPLAPFWFGRVSALPPRLTTLSRRALWLALPVPGLTVLQSWYQGAIVHSRRTRGVTESLAAFLLATSAVLWAGVLWSQAAGLYFGLAGLTVGSIAQTAWLWIRSRPAMQAVQQRDRAPSTA